MFGFSNIFHPETAPADVPLTFKIICKADENYCLTVHDGDAAFAPADPKDECQHWYKDKRFGAYVKDEEGKLAFSLVNKATSLAVQHCGGPFYPVKLVRFDLDSFDNTLMWTLSDDDLGKDGFGYIRTLNDISLKMATFSDDRGVTVRLSDSCDGDTHHWKILPWRDEGCIAGGVSMRLYCKADESFSLTVRNGTVCLAPTNPKDEHQHWIEDTRYGEIIKDEDGYPAFALVNRATGDAIKRSDKAEGPVKLVPYDPYYLDKSVLWSKSGNMMHHFHHIRMVDSIYLKLDICDKGHDDKCYSRVQDGAKVMLSYWHEGDNQYWRIVPWSNQSGRDQGP